MRAFEYHPLTKVTVKETLILNLSFSQVGWIALGVFLSVQAYKIVPAIPLEKMGIKLFLGLEKVLGGLYNLIPLGICIAFAYITHSSGMSFSQFLGSYIEYRIRKRTKKTNQIQ